MDVDDCTIITSNLALVAKVKEDMRKYIEVTDLGELHWSLGIEIKRNREARTISLTQHSYVKASIHSYNFDDLKPLSMPMDSNVHLSTSQSPSTACDYATMCHIPYREALGSLMWAAQGT